MQTTDITMNLPNLLTILRIFLVPFFAFFLLRGEVLEGLIVFTGASLTDGLDGYIARAYNRKTRLGALLDPLADKILLLTAYLLLAFLKALPFWLSAVVVIRDLIILTGITCIYIVHGNIDFSPSLLGKATTFVQLATVFLTLLRNFVPLLVPLSPALFIFTAVITIISCIHYVILGVRMGRPTPDPVEDER